ncbi:MAG: LysM peptidoglycan-binding domain-containing protein [Epsilonproteobacteria bacterium]|nr:hypothetical protein [Campylobacterota bacterium]NPA56166.1 LysM peptidoglycan-binding domain-containing protein [Campylobacterota bacterium]
MEPDQLEKLDVQKVLLKKKEKGSSQKVAKTAYLNNQAIISTQTQKKSGSDEVAQVAQELTSLIVQVEKKEKEKKTSSSSQGEAKKESSQYLKGLSSEIKTREKTMRFYIVKKGDTLSKIAKRIYGKAGAYIKIYEANQDIISDPKLIYPGQRLRIPK